MRRNHFLLLPAVLVAMGCSEPPTPAPAPPRVATFVAVPVYMVKAPGPKNDPSCTVRSNDPRAVGWQSWTKVYVRIHVDEGGVVDLVREVGIREGPAVGVEVLEAIRQCANTVAFENPKHEPMEQAFELYVKEQS